MIPINKNIGIQSNESEPQPNDDPNEIVTRRNQANKAPQFAYSVYIEEGHGKTIYAVEFCNRLEVGEEAVFVTCGSNLATIYECRNDGGIKLLQCYADPNPNEEYYTCCWSYDSNTTMPILAVAGKNKIIRIINPTTATSNKHFIGHGHSITELKFHPINPSILLSASRDYSVRLWNIQTDVCIAILLACPTTSILSADFDGTGNRIVTGGVNGRINIWHLNEPSIENAIVSSLTFKQNHKQRLFKTLTKYFSDYSVDTVHYRLVDCVKWMGNLIISKSNENSVVCWKPGTYFEDNTTDATNSSNASIIRKLKYARNKLCFIRFSMNKSKTYLALGNERGTTFIWQLDRDEPTKATLRHYSCRKPVRATAFSPDSKILVSVCDDSTVWKWDKIDSYNYNSNN